MQRSTFWILALLPALLVLAVPLGAIGQSPYGPSPYGPAPFGPGPYGPAPQYPYPGVPAAYAGQPPEGALIQGAPGIGAPVPGVPFEGAIGEPAPLVEDTGSVIEGEVVEDVWVDEDFGNDPGLGFLERIPYLGSNRAFGTGDICNPRWYDISAEYVELSREDVSRTVNFSTLGPAGPTVLSTDDLAFQDQSGFRIGGQVLVGVSTSLEGNYMGTLFWDSAATAVSPANLLFSPYSDFGTGPLALDADLGLQHSIYYSSQLDTFELSLRRRWVSPNCRIHTSAFMGARYMAVEEHFSFTTLTPFGQSAYRVRTENDLVGFQAGGDISAMLFPRLRLGMEGKAGIYGNGAEQSTRLRSSPVGVPAELGDFAHEFARNDQAAFVGEGSAYMVFRVTSRFAIRGSYEVMYIDGLALAPEQFNANPNVGTRPARINMNGDIFLHGWTGGLEWMW